jgi:hypothetical protein
MRRPSLVFALLVLSTTSAHADQVVRTCNHDAEGYALFGMAAALFGACAVIRYSVRHFQRVRDAQLATPVPISLLVAERIARSVQRRAGVIATVGIAGVPALVVMHTSSLAILSTIVGCIGLRSFFITRGMLQLIERVPPGVAASSEGVTGAASIGERAGAAPITAEVLGQTLIVRGSDEEVSLDVSPRALAAARRHAVPTSIATER